jgi:hypothetical protein
MKQTLTLAEWMGFKREHIADYDYLFRWMEKKRADEYAGRFFDFIREMEPCYWVWFNIGRMVEFLDEHERPVLDILGNLNDVNLWCDRLWSEVIKLLRSRCVA